MVKFVVLATLAIEVAGAAAMYPMWRAHAKSIGAGSGVFHTVFHSVSAFCNAGFALQRENLIALRAHWQVLGIIAPLIFLGGLGFPVLYDLARAGWSRLRRLLGRGSPAVQAMTLHSKLVLTTSVLLVAGGALVLLAVELGSYPGQTYSAPIIYQDNPPDAASYQPLAKMPLGAQVQESLFQSVTARTAGFNTYPMEALSPGGKLWMCLLMIVGGSPASTAGGMKTVTVAVLALAIWSILRHREQVEGFHRSIAATFVHRAVTLAGLYLALVALVTLLLCVSMNGRRLASSGELVTFMDLFFEACSACGTVGLSCAVTDSLTTFAKYVIILAMFVGRLGPLTVLLALTVRLKPARYAYASEEVVLG